jgi:hypothetical protein
MVDMVKEREKAVLIVVEEHYLSKKLVYRLHFFESSIIN